MSKSILVIDTPDSCFSCYMCHTKDYDYRIQIDGEKFCGVENMNVDDYCDYEKRGKPDWCPLREIPQKYYPVGMNFEFGWNAYIDEILKERDENE